MFNQAKMMLDQTKALQKLQAKGMQEQYKIMMEGLRQQSQSQMQILVEISGTMGGQRQQRQQIAPGPTRQLSDELGG